MPGTIRVTVLELVDLPGGAGKKYYIKVSIGKREFKTPSNATFSAEGGSLKVRPYNQNYEFAVLNIADPLVATLYDKLSNVAVGNLEIKVPTIVEKGLRDELFPFSNGGRVHLKVSFVLSEEEKRKIIAMRSASLKKRMEEKGQGSAPAGGANSGHAPPSSNPPLSASGQSRADPPAGSLPSPGAGARLPAQSPAIPDSMGQQGRRPDGGRQVAEAERPAAQGRGQVASPAASEGGPQDRWGGAGEAAAAREPSRGGGAEKFFAVREISDRAEVTAGTSGPDSPKVAAAPPGRSREGRAEDGGGALAPEGKGLGRAVKQIMGAAAVLVALVLLWPKDELPPQRRRQFPKGTLHVVKKGESLRSILPPEEFCDPNSEFFKLNPGVCDINVIFEGQKILLPPST